MSARIKLRKCTICHKSFGWNGTTRCLCNECKAQNVSGNSSKNYERPFFIMVKHGKDNRASA